MQEDRIFISKETFNRMLKDVKDIVMQPLHSHGIYYIHNEDDMLKGIDTKIEKDGKTYTGQIKGFKERIDKDDKIILKGTGKVKMYSTDWMIFQKGRNVLIFNKKPNIIGGNFVFPKDGLLYDIK